MSFESLTDEKIKQLIELPKRVTNPGAREMDDGGYLRRDFKVVSAAGDEQEFRLFTRQNKTVSNDFLMRLTVACARNGWADALALQWTQPFASKQA
jgi:hypothetical protein